MSSDSMSTLSEKYKEPQKLDKETKEALDKIGLLSRKETNENTDSQ